MTVKQRRFTYFQSHPEGVDDNELTRTLGIKYHAQTNARCRELQNEGLVIRRRVNGIIHNYLTGKNIAPIPEEPVVVPKGTPYKEMWIWEGNIQKQVIKHLITYDFQILSKTDTESHQPGIDIMAEKNGKQLWVSVKGYPIDSEHAKAGSKARIWFESVIFDMVAYRGRDENVSLAVALPDFPRYHALAKQISWFKPVARYNYFWVRENGEVVVE